MLAKGSEIIAKSAGMVDRLSPIDRSVKTAWPARKAVEQPQDAAACASGGAIGDNGSTLEGLLVDRLSPIDRSVKIAWPVRKAAEQPQDAAACASGGAIGDNGSTLWAYW